MLHFRHLSYVDRISVSDKRTEGQQTNTIQIQISLIQYDKRIHINEYNK